MPQRYLSILDAHPELICRKTPDLILTYVNKSFAEFFGASVESFMGESLLNVMQAKDHDKVKAKLATLTAEAPATHVPSTRVNLAGDTVHLEWTIIALFDEGGGLKEYQSLGRDITESLALSDALKFRNIELESAQAEMRMVLDSIPSKVWYKDDKNAILKLNAVAAEAMNMAISEVEGKNTYDLFGDSAKAYHEADLQVIKSGKALKGIIERFTPNEGTQGWVQTDKIPFDHPITGEKRILVVSTDITELKNNEAMLKTINKNLDDFASLTSHDLQAPLRHIAVFAELLEAEYGDKIGEDGHKYISEITGGVANMRGMIKSFLKFMRSSPEGIELDHVDFNEVIDHVVERHQLELDKFGGEINLPKKKIFVRGEAVLLKQVIGNLVENAIKYRDLDVPVQVDITARLKQGMWRIGVADNGVGIDKASAANVFHLFGRAKPHAHREGSGVGLALCKRIITLHGGEIELNPNREKGSEFILTLNESKFREGQ